MLPAWLANTDNTIVCLVFTVDTKLAGFRALLIQAPLRRVQLAAIHEKTVQSPGCGVLVGFRVRTQLRGGGLARLMREQFTQHLATHRPGLR